MRRSLPHFLSGACVLLLASACDSKPEPDVSAKAPPAAEVKPEPKPAAAAGAKSDKKPKKNMPTEARRNTPPEGLDASALAVGTPSPPLEDLSSTTGTWSRESAPAIVVFYRGSW